MTKNQYTGQQISQCKRLARAVRQYENGTYSRFNPRYFVTKRTSETQKFGDESEKWVFHVKDYKEGATYRLTCTWRKPDVFEWCLNALLLRVL